MVMERWRPSSMRAWWPSRATEEMERFTDEMLAGWPFRAWRRVPAAELSWSPPLEMYEKEDKFVIRLELPGVNLDEMDISMVGDTLTIKGDRRLTRDVKEEEYHRCEMAYGSFARLITMPAAVDVEHIEATYEDGILELSVPKGKEAKPSKIPIKAKAT
jgi:HSP20 family protein